MKYFLILLVISVLPVASVAQYYNPYAPSYQQQQQMNQRAYEWGAKLMEQQLERQETQLKQNPTMMMGVAVEDMAYGRYEKAYERFEYLAENYNDKNAWLYMGYMNELGMGTSKSYNYAKVCYEHGAKLGEPNCKAELQRIKQRRYLGNEYKERLRSYFQNIVAMSMPSVNLNNNGYGNNNNAGSYGSNSGTNSDRLTCPTCHGSQKCTMCAGNGWYIYDGSHFGCDMCKGRGVCYGCNGRGWIR